MKIVDIWKDFATNGFFTNTDITFFNDVLTAEEKIILDTMLLNNTLCDLNTSRLFNTLFTENTAEKINLICSVIKMQYNKKWTKLFDLFETEYKPLENYNRIEDLTNTFKPSVTTIDTLAHGKITSEDISAMNDTSYSPNSKTANSGNDVNTNTKTGEDVTNDNNKIYGNIGVTTTQDMFKQEIELLNNFSYWSIIFNDISNILCINIYD